MTKCKASTESAVKWLTRKVISIRGVTFRLWLCSSIMSKTMRIGFICWNSSGKSRCCWNKCKWRNGQLTVTSWRVAGSSDDVGVFDAELTALWSLNRTSTRRPVCFANVRPNIEPLTLPRHSLRHRWRLKSDVLLTDRRWRHRRFFWLFRLSPFSCGLVSCRRPFIVSSLS